MPRHTDTPFEQRADSLLFALANKGYPGRDGRDIPATSHFPPRGANR